MRIGFAILVWVLGALAVPASAHASSFVTIEPPSEAVSPSFVVLGDPAPPPPAAQAAAGPGDSPPRSPLDRAPDYVRDDLPRVVSPSIVAMGEPAPDEVKVAAVPKPVRTARADPFSTPVVIRGGIVGDAFTSAPAPSFTPAPPVETRKEKPRKTARSEPKPEPPPEKPRAPQAPPPPPPGLPTGILRGPE